MMDGINPVSLAIVIIYMSMLAFIGWISRNKVKSCSDWYVGNFQIGGVIMGVAFFATYFSAVLMVGFAGSASKWGMSATVIGMWHPVAALIAFAVLAPTLAKMFRSLGAMTFSEFLTLRFKSQLLGSLSSLLTAIFIIPYTVSAFLAMGTALSLLVNMPIWVGIVASGIIIALYVFTGGLFSATLAEFLQGIIMTVAVVCVWAVSYSILGGFLPAHEALASISISAVTFPALGSPLWTTMIGLTAVMGFGMLAQPQMVLRYSTICSKMDVKKAMVIAVFGSLIFPLAAYSYGPLSRAILALPEYGIDVMTIANDNVIIPTFVNLALPSWLAALFLIGILGAAVSTIDALVHLMAGTVTRDLIIPILKPKITDKGQLNTTKVLSLVLSLGSCIVAAIFSTGLIYQLASYTWRVLASAFMGPILAAVFIKGANKTGALTGMVVGFLSSQLWYLYSNNIWLAIFNVAKCPIDPFFIGVPLSIIATVIGNRFGKAPEDIVKLLFK